MANKPTGPCLPLGTSPVVNPPFDVVSGEAQSMEDPPMADQNCLNLLDMINRTVL